MATTVHVKNISPQTSEKEVRDFFSFCGKISSLTVTPESDGPDAPKSASVTFEKETAAKTALLLDNTQLGPAQVHVTAAKSIDEMAGGKTSEETEVPQEEKPKARILAEMIAHGYHFSNAAIEKALAVDRQRGFSNRFTQALQSFDSKYKATDTAKSMDAKYGVSDRAVWGWNGLSSYFDKAASTPTGQKLRAFYMEGQKQVMDVHNEALHLQQLKYGDQGPFKTGGAAGSSNTPHPASGNPERTECSCAADTGSCPCAAGTCACSGCAKNPDFSTGADPEKMEMEKVGEDGKTKCNCAGDAQTCPCPPGKCTCGSCAKNPEKA